MNMERAARIHQYGAPEVLAVEPVEVTAPGPGEVRIRHKAIGLNFVEVYFRRGTFPVPAFPAILGNEAAGVVEAVGRDVRGSPTAPEWQLSTTQSAATRFSIRCGRCDRAAPGGFRQGIR